MSVAAEYPFTKNAESGASVHLPSEHLDPLHVTFDRAGTAGQEQLISDGCVVGVEASSEAVQVWGDHLPRWQTFTSSIIHQGIS